MKIINIKQDPFKFEIQVFLFGLKVFIISARDLYIWEKDRKIRKSEFLNAC